MAFTPWELVYTHPAAFVAVIFLLDGLGVPLLPEVAVLFTFALNPTLAWGATLLAIVVAMEVLASALLYGIVRFVGIPGWLDRLLSGYSKSLLVSDERLLLLNRVVPVLPMSGAFVHIRGWSVPRSFAYIAVGSLAKYGLLILGSSVAYRYFESGIALWVGLGLAGLFLAASWGFSFARWYAARRLRRDVAA